jgi:hypothetical protein
MADSIIMTFTKDVNKSLQINDIVYHQKNDNTLQEVGKCTAISGKVLTCEIPEAQVRPTGSQMILFSKDNKANLSSIDGYFAEVKMKNDDTAGVELYAVSSEIFESSK